HRRMSGKRTIRFECRATVDVRLEQRASDAVAHCASLPERPAASHTHLHIIFGGTLGDRKRFSDRDPLRLGRKIIFERSSIDDNFTAEGGKTHSGGGRFATAGDTKILWFSF